MTDVFSKQKRSEVMSRIQSRDTIPERAVRSMLHRKGYRFRLHVRGLPGRPDIVLPRLRTIVFVHGCFWHRHSGCRFAYTPKTRLDFWTNKFESNVTRDLRTRLQLRKLGWRVLTIWECELRVPARLSRRLDAALARARPRQKEMHNAR